ncbi:MAG: Ig domain-containing protein [Protaetiibacter sp.]
MRTRRAAAFAAALPLALFPALLVASPSVAATVPETVVDAPASVVSVDGTSTERGFVITSTGVVRAVTVTVDFLKTDGWCEVPDSGYPYHEETGFWLRSPSGTTVPLVNYATYTATTTSRVAITFDDSAASLVSYGQAPVSGTFRPAGALAAFNGENAAGAWQLTVGDSAGADPLCYYGATLTVSASAPPTLPAATLATGVVGAAYTGALPTVAGATGYAIVDAADLPPGVTFDGATGAFGGIPTANGSYPFEATVTDADGTSTATAFTIAVDEGASLVGASTADAALGVPFSYAPTVGFGRPAATLSLVGTLPAGLGFDAVTGAITGTPNGTMGDYAVEIHADNGVGSGAMLPVTISVDHGAVAALTVTPGATPVAQGGHLDFVVVAEDAFGNSFDVTGEYTLSSSVASDVVSGSRVSFPHASPHTITAIHTATGVTGSVTVQVRPAALAATGADGDANLSTTLAAALAVLLGAGLLVLGRRSRRA